MWQTYLKFFFPYQQKKGISEAVLPIADLPFFNLYMWLVVHLLKQHGGYCHFSNIKRKTYSLLPVCPQFQTSSDHEGTKIWPRSISDPHQLFLWYFDVYFFFLLQLHHPSEEAIVPPQCIAFPIAIWDVVGQQWSFFWVPRSPLVNAVGDQHGLWLHVRAAGIAQAELWIDVVMSWLVTDQGALLVAHVL